MDNNPNLWENRKYIGSDTLVPTVFANHRGTLLNIMSKILITGARAPIAWEWANILTPRGDDVVLGDNFSFPIGRFASQTRYLRLPPPRDYQRYIDTIQAEDFDLVIPTCEEAFYLSHAKNRLREGVLFSHDFDFMKSAHDKFNVFQLFESDVIRKPKTLLIPSPGELPKDEEKLKRSVLKPRFSRFGNQAILEITPRAIQRMLPCEYVLQEKIIGDELCSYSLCFSGRVKHTVVYKPVYRLRAGASIYFRPVIESRIDEFVRNFVEQHHCHGQLAFDFMLTESDELFLLECNPRGTSGIHLLRGMVESASFFEKETPVSQRHVSTAKPIEPLCLKTMMILLAPKLIREKGLNAWAKDCAVARDVFPIHTLPWGLTALAELIARSIISRQSLEETSTADICWNGEELD